MLSVLIVSYFRFFQYSHSHSYRFVRQNSHSTNANFHELRHIPKSNTPFWQC